MNTQHDYSPISHGRSIGSLHLDGFALTEAIYEPHSKVPQHSHEFASMTFVLEGEVTERIERRAETLSRNRMLLKPSGTTHSNAFGRAGARLLLLEVFTNRQNTHAASHVFREVRPLPASSLRQPLLRALKEMRRADAYSAMCVEGIMLDLLATLGRSTAVAGQNVPACVLRVRDRLHDDFRTTVRIGELARDENMDPCVLSRAFRHAFGRGIGEYVRTVRLDWAMRSLVDSHECIATIALSAGYSDQSHFTREMKSATGMTPAEYRRLRIDA